MNNYLSHRWPAGMLAQPEPPKKKPRKTRRAWRSVLIVAVALLLIAGLTAGSFFGIQFAAERYLAGQQGQNQQPGQAEQPDGGKEDKPPLPTTDQSQGAEWSPEGILRGEPTAEFTMELLSREGQLPMTSTEIYKKVLPSIVLVEAANSVGYGTGSGVIISADGYIITNYHIIEGAEATSIAIMRLSDRKTYENVALVAWDKELDLAILKADGQDFVPAELGSSDELEVGDPVYAIGNPMGYLYGSMTEGIVSATGERVSMFNYPGRLIQTSASLNSGNSGGALVDAYGRVVGITCAKLTGIHNDVVIEGVGLAIPMSDAEPYLARMLRHGYSSRPSIGISCYEVEVNGRPGIYVAETTPDTPAAKVLMPGDVILSANGVPAASVDDLTRVFAWLEPGDKVELVVLRDTRELTITLALYERLPETE